MASLDQIPSPTDGEARTRRFLAALCRDLKIAPAAAAVRFDGSGDLPSVFAVSDLAAAAVGAAGAACAELVAAATGRLPEITVSRRLASLWFGYSLQPVGWELPAAWGSIAGDYAASDGWVRLHTNAPHHCRAALSVLGVPEERTAVAREVARWRADELEEAVIAAQGCAAAMRATEAWAVHPQGASVAREPLVALEVAPDSAALLELAPRERPLEGIRVLDLTRVLAGPVATRFLAGLGAEVLRIDPPDWEEPAVVPDVTLGKRCARLDLRTSDGRTRLLGLLREADVLVHGYRPGALERLGLDRDTRRGVRPALVDVCLSAYGWTGPWRERRGFDSLVQMSAGIAEAGMRRLGKDRPFPLPVQALDHATGYLLAAAVLRGLTERATSGRGIEARASLARTAWLLLDGPPGRESGELRMADARDWGEGLEATPFGPARRLRPPLAIDSKPLQWERSATRLGSSAPSW